MFNLSERVSRMFQAASRVVLISDQQPRPGTDSAAAIGENLKPVRRRRNNVPREEMSQKLTWKEFISCLNEDDFEEGKKFSRGHLNELFRTIPSNDIQANISSDRIPHGALVMMIFIHCADKNLFWKTPPNTTLLSNLELRGYLYVSSKYLEAYPEAQNLTRLYKALRKLKDGALNA